MVLRNHGMRKNPKGMCTLVFRVQRQYARWLYMEELTDFFCLFLNYFILAGGSVCSVSVLLKLDC